MGGEGRGRGNVRWCQVEWIEGRGYQKIRVGALWIWACMWVDGRFVDWC